MGETVGRAWRQVRDLFRQWQVDTPELDARLLAREAFGPQVDLLHDEHAAAGPEAVLRLQGLAARRIAGEPVARILGRQEFYGLDFALTADTLIPRPETELLVDLALDFVARRPEARILDLGTGTGCIAIAVLANASGTQAVAVDLSPGALLCATDNARRNGVAERLTLRHGSWFEPLREDETFDLILSNPPYVESASLGGLQREVRLFDPALALDGGPDGVEPYRVIAAATPAWLRPGGTLAVEIGSSQADAVSTLFTAAGLHDVEVRKDLAGLDRVVIAHHS